MKKFLTALLMIAMIVAMTSVAFALTPGDVYIKEDDDDDYYTDDIDTISPGQTAYVFLGDYVRGEEGGPSGSENAPKSIKIDYDEVEFYDNESDEEVKKLITVTSKGQKKKIGDSDPKYGWFAQIKAKSVKMSSYPEDGYDIIGALVLEFTWDGNEYTKTINLDTVSYDEADEEFEDDAKMFEYEKDDDVEIDLPDEDGIFTGVARKDFEVVASMNTKVNSSLLNKYPNADIRFYNGSGTVFPVSKGKMIIYADSDEYCYEVNSKNELIDRTSTYNSSQDGFVISTTTIGKYIVSDTKLNKSTNVTASTAPNVNEYIGSTPITQIPNANVSGNRTYTVVAGDSLWLIAQRQLGNGWRYPEIVSLNNLRNNFIYSGQVLKLPN